jgi:DNA polymerase III subunit delta'
VELQGHQTTRKLLRELSAHTLLFVGPESVGRRRTAQWYAAFLNCQNPAPEPCWKCASCQQITYGSHPDYREVMPATTTSTGRLSRRPEIRIGQLVPREGDDGEPLSHWLETRPTYRWRVGVIDSAHTMNVSAANAFLKLLEEPPSYARIILIAPSPQAVLPTIASRAVTVRFGTVAPQTSYPLAHLGRPGDYLLQQANQDTFNELDEVLERYVACLSSSLEDALEAAEHLEKRWLDATDFKLAELLLDKLRVKAPVSYALAHDALSSLEAALAAYASTTIAMQVFTLQLRQALQTDA